VREQEWLSCVHLDLPSVRFVRGSVESNLGVAEVGAIGQCLIERAPGASFLADRARARMR